MVLQENEAAREKLEEALQLSPEDPETLTIMGRTLFAMGDYTYAIPEQMEPGDRGFQIRVSLPGFHPVVQDLLRLIPQGELAADIEFQLIASIILVPFHALVHEGQGLVGLSQTAERLGFMLDQPLPCWAEPMRRAPSWRRPGICLCATTANITAVRTRISTKP